MFHSQLKRYSPVSDEDVLEQDVMKVQHDLDIEEVYLSDERHKFERDVDLRQQVLNPCFFIICSGCSCLVLFEHWS